MIGHNPKANHQSEDFLADDFQDVAALLRELPRVAAPTDFNASLKARLAIARAEVNEFAGVTALVKELPRVAAPADFDFKLRARIAQAKAEQQQSSAGWFAALFGRTFSWVQASAALAAVAIVVSVVSFGVLRGENLIAPAGSTTIASNVDPSPVASTSTQVPAASQSQIPGMTNAQPGALANVTVKPKTIRYAPQTSSHQSIGTGSRNGNSDLPPTPPSSMVATKVMIKHQSGEARMVNLSEYNLGLQTAHLRSTPATPRSVETAAVNIY